MSPKELHISTCICRYTTCHTYMWCFSSDSTVCGQLLFHKLLQSGNQTVHPTLYFGNLSDINYKPSKPRRSISQTHVKCSPPIIMHHANPFLAAVRLAVSTRMSGNKKDWPKRDPTCTLTHSHCHSVDLAILFYLNFYPLHKSLDCISLWKLFIWRSLLLHYTAGELQESVQSTAGDDCIPPDAWTNCITPWDILQSLVNINHWPITGTFVRLVYFTHCYPRCIRRRGPEASTESPLVRYSDLRLPHKLKTSSVVVLGNEPIRAKFELNHRASRGFPFRDGGGRGYSYGWFPHPSHLDCKPIFH